MILTTEGHIEVKPNQNLLLRLGRSLLSCNLISFNRTSSDFLNYYKNKYKRLRLLNNSSFFKAFKSADVTNNYFKSQLALLQKEEEEKKLNEEEEEENK